MLDYLRSTFDKMWLQKVVRSMGELPSPGSLNESCCSWWLKGTILQKTLAYITQLHHVQWYSRSVASRLRSIPDVEDLAPGTVSLISHIYRIYIYIHI